MQYDDVTTNQYGGRTPFLISFNGYISAPYCLTNAKFGVRKRHHMKIHATCPKL